MQGYYFKRPVIDGVLLLLVEEEPNDGFLSDLTLGVVVRAVIGRVVLLRIRVITKVSLPDITHHGYHARSYYKFLDFIFLSCLYYSLHAFNSRLHHLLLCLILCARQWIRQVNHIV